MDTISLLDTFTPRQIHASLSVCTNQPFCSGIHCSTHSLNECNVQSGLSAIFNSKLIILLYVSPRI